MIAHLGMYGSSAANAGLWMRIRLALGYGPDQLTPSEDVWRIWEHPDLLFSQTCGYPYRARLHDKVQLIGTPDYGVAGCPPGYYRSVFVKRRGDPRHDLSGFQGACFAYNDALSQSGWAAPVAQMVSEGVRPGALVETGGHAASARAIADGSADFAALDAVTWEMIARSEMEITDQIVPFAETAPSPGLPYITGPKGDSDALARAVTEAIETLPVDTREMLLLRGLALIPAEDYLAVPTPPSPHELIHSAASSSR